MIDFSISFNTGLRVPEHTAEALENYLVRGWKPGGFCESMLAMDIPRAVHIADPENKNHMWATAYWIVSSAPKGSWGSYEAVDAWCQDRQRQRTTFVEAVERSEVWNILSKS